MNNQKTEATQTIPHETEPADKPQAQTPPNETVEIPTLLGFVSEERAKVSQFYKSIRKASIKRFSPSDESESLARIRASENAPHLLWTLVSQSQIPEAIDAWVWNAIQCGLTNAVDVELDFSSPDNDAILSTLLNWISSQDKETANQKRQRAEVWFRLGTVWLVTKRSLDPWVLLERTRTAKFKTPADAAKRAFKAIAKGKTQEFELAIATSGMASKIVATAVRERDEERGISNKLRADIHKLQLTLENLSNQCAELKSQIESLQRTESTLSAELQSVKNHSAHELSQQKTKFRRILNSDYRQILTDARDALEIQPASTETALARIQEVLAKIGKDAT